MLSVSREGLVLDAVSVLPTLIGCKGVFELTAGTGKFQGVTGSGPIVFRTAIAQFARKLSEDSAKSIGLGLTAWPRLTYRLR